ncbi:MAG TPA: class I SAM-dependent methyltransferase [Candidatus Dormibacteraeota bacterium]|nr:class I SAM-dependent methyltransferase [Candidatus Dormibacteraeota bacterium]
MQVAPRAPSRSAIVTAAVRALHREEPQPWVLDDLLAAGLAGEEGKAIIANLREKLSRDELRAFAHWVCIRARLTEDVVERELAQGASQYVILGAGLDSFAYRRRELVDRLRVFEVDHPASQEWKRNRLLELGVTPPANLVYCAVDFETESLVDRLTSCGFDWEQRAIFSWIGVTMYLTSDAIRGTLDAIGASARGSAIAMTYNQPMETLDDFSRDATSKLANAIGEMGERFVTFFTPSEAAELMRQEGFVDAEDFGGHEAYRTYLGDRVDVKVAGAQRLIVARVP